MQLGFVLAMQGFFNNWIPVCTGMTMLILGLPEDMATTAAGSR
jgi:hypothetical protein